MTEGVERPGKPPVFHEKRTYRRRRLREAARLAPLLTLFLWIVPLLWPQTGEGRISSASALIYIFVVWASVILLTWVLSITVGRDGDTDAGEGQ